jgi:aerobic-type carbon monoxide dehydrogenase small subunit (CoxS/CutS family)
MLTLIMPDTIKLKVNGAEHEARVDPNRSLLSVLRDDLDLTGAKYGCGEGECGACTVLLDGNPVRSCRTRVGNVASKEILTIEGLTPVGGLHPVQQAFLDKDAMQCGYCTCGMIMSAAALLRKTPHPTRDEIIKAMDGNICRCGVYGRIVDAVAAAASASTASNSGKL